MLSNITSQICTHTRVGNNTSYCIDDILSKIINLIRAVIKTITTDYYIIIGILKNSQENYKYIDTHSNLTSYIDYGKAVRLLSC